MANLLLAALGVAAGSLGIWVLVQLGKRSDKLPKTLLAGALGAIITVLPIVVLAGVVLSQPHHGNGQLGLGIVFAFIVSGALGIVTGLFGGLLYYGYGQRFWTAASLSLGTVIGVTTALLITVYDSRPRPLPPPGGRTAPIESHPEWMWLAIFAGIALGLISTFITWRSNPK